MEAVPISVPEHMQPRKTNHHGMTAFPFADSGFHKEAEQRVATVARIPESESRANDMTNRGT
jgi:hypothetical protein